MRETRGMPGHRFLVSSAVVNAAFVPARACGDLSEPDSGVTVLIDQQSSTAPAQVQDSIVDDRSSSIFVTACASMIGLSVEQRSAGPLTRPTSGFAAAARRRPPPTAGTSGERRPCAADAD